MFLFKISIFFTLKDLGPLFCLVMPLIFLLQKCVFYCPISFTLIPLRKIGHYGTGDNSYPHPASESLAKQGQAICRRAGVNIILRNQESSGMKILHIRYCPVSVAILINLNPPVCQKYPRFLKVPINL